MTATQPVFILIRPQMGENIGAAARAMLNFGLERMRVVAPRDGWPSTRAVAMASGAARVLDAAGLYTETAEAVADVQYLFATTARGRGLTKPVMTPAHAMQAARALIAEGANVGVLFGPERAGLENDDIARVNAIISIPTSAQFSSLNLGQAVLLMAYEWGRQQSDQPPEVLAMARAEQATIGDVERLVEHFEDELDAAEFFFPPEKAAGMRLNLRNLWSRMPLSDADVRMLHGIVRKLAGRR